MASEYIKINYYIMDDERLKNPDQPSDDLEGYCRYNSKRLYSSTPVISDCDKTVKQIEASKKKMEDGEK